MRLRYLADRLEHLPALDGPARLLSSVWDTVLPDGKARDVLYGTWLGHPLHPLLTDVAIGCWTGAAALDVTGNDRGSRALTGLGVLAAIPTAAAGAADYVAIGENDEAKRVGAIHALANATGTMLYAASWLARRKGNSRTGKVLGALALGTVSAGGYLGGHLAFRNAIGADRNADTGTLDDWTDLGNLHSLPMRTPLRKTVGGTDVLVYRIGSTVRVLAARCAHLGGPLDEGTIDDECVTCPWHGSAFDLRDGSVVHGPSTHPQPAYDVRVVGRTVQIRSRNMTDQDNPTRELERV